MLEGSSLARGADSVFCPSQEHGGLSNVERAGTILRTPVEQNGCGSMGTVGDAADQGGLGCLNKFGRMVTVGEELSRLVTRSVRLAKAKVVCSRRARRNFDQILSKQEGTRGSLGGLQWTSRLSYLFGTTENMSSDARLPVG